jgi:hypothetical protein
MKTWIYKMVALNRHFRLAAEQAPASDSPRIYLDRRSRTWSDARQRSYVAVVDRDLTHAVGRRPRC